MKNAKQELDKFLQNIGKTYKDIDYYKIIRERSFYAQREIDIDSLDFSYDSGFGGQELHGIIVFKDGTWLERGEYDGAEWWEYKRKPSREKVKNFKGY